MAFETVQNTTTLQIRGSQETSTQMAAHICYARH